MTLIAQHMGAKQADFCLGIVVVDGENRQTGRIVGKLAIGCQGTNGLHVDSCHQGKPKNKKAANGRLFQATRLRIPNYLEM